MECSQRSWRIGASLVGKGLNWWEWLDLSWFNLQLHSNVWLRITVVPIWTHLFATIINLWICINLHKIKDSGQIHHFSDQQCWLITVYPLALGDLDLLCVWCCLHLSSMHAVALYADCLFHIILRLYSKNQAVAVHCNFKIATIPAIVLWSLTRSEHLYS